MKNQIEFKLICQQGPSALKSCKYVIDYSGTIRSAIDSTKILGTEQLYFGISLALLDQSVINALNAVSKSMMKML